MGLLQLWLHPHGTSSCRMAACMQLLQAIRMAVWWRLMEWVVMRHVALLALACMQPVLLASLGRCPDPPGRVHHAHTSRMPGGPGLTRAMRMPM